MADIQEANDNIQRTTSETDIPLAAWFLGPKAEHRKIWTELLLHIFNDYVYWRRNYFPNDPIIITRVRRRQHEEWFDFLNENLDKILNNLKAHFPFYSPRYIAHMLSEQTLPSVLGYFAGMLYNPNNVTDEAAPVTVKLELEVGRIVAEMLGYNPARSWAHICSGGTVANIEALWVARTVQFIPFTVRDFCKQEKIDFVVKTANGKQRPIVKLADKEIINLRPNEAIFMIRKLAKYLVDGQKRSPDTVISDINAFIQTSNYNLNKKGVYEVIQRLGMKPVIFASAATHYSVKKAVNILGYGEDTVRLVPVTSRFRMDVEALRSMLYQLNDNEYIAAVVGIVGTTEEGAVDPIHEIKFLRNDLAKDRNQSFWLHIDAAWGGYVRTLFCGHPLERKEEKRDLDDICSDYIKAIDAKEKFYIKVSYPEHVKRPREVRPVEAVWADREVYSAFLAMEDADSITVDPHKMGYMPYPSGIIAFRNGLVTELIAQKAHYIFDVEEGINTIDEPIEINAIGPYILEGSKPGAAATAGWLAHKTIPLTVSGHGKIIRTSLLNAKKLVRYLHYHKHLFHSIEARLEKEYGRCVHPFTFSPLYEPDTNVVCFITVPMVWHSDKLTTVDMDLQRINLLNRKIYNLLTISKSERGEKPPYGQPYFVSRTQFESDQYPYNSIKPVLGQLNISQKDYEQFGLFVLRSTVMNPFYYTAEEEGIDYLRGFVEHLHKITHQIINEIYDDVQN